MTKRLFAIALVLLSLPALRAQEEGISVSGTVRNLHTGTPEPYCIVQLLQEGVSRVLRMTDEEGYFHIDDIAEGHYTLHVTAGYQPLYQADLDLVEDAQLDILIDTVKRVDLRAISIFARRKQVSLPDHQLGHKLITSADDPRLWNFSGKMEDSGPASANLSVPGGGDPFKRMLLYGTRPIWYYETPPPKKTRARSEGQAATE